MISRFCLWVQCRDWWKFEREALGQEKLGLVWRNTYHSFHLCPLRTNQCLFVTFWHSWLSKRWTVWGKMRLLDFCLCCVFVLLHFSCAACDVYTLIIWSLTFVLGQFGQVSIKKVLCKLPSIDSSQTKFARLMLLQRRLRKRPHDQTRANHSSLAPGFPWGRYHFRLPTPHQLSDWLHPESFPADQWDP